MDPLYAGVPDLVEAGNIDLSKRPRVKNPDGSISTVRSLGVNFDGVETLIPTVHPDGYVMSDKDAIDYYKQTGQHLGKFKSVNSSNSFAVKLHLQQESRYVTPDPTLSKPSLPSDYKPSNPSEFNTPKSRLLYGMLSGLADTRRQMTGQLLHQVNQKIMKGNTTDGNP